MTAVPGYRPGALASKSVLFTRLAVSDDLGDARTGVILSGTTRLAAMRDACSRVERRRPNGSVLCPSAFDQQTAELERLFARNETIPPHVIETIRANSRADLVLLFRPESVAASQDLKQQKIYDATTALPTSTIVSGTYAEPIQTVSKTELSYTLSASLIDLRTGARIKNGVHSRRTSLVAKRNVGVAEAPPAAPLLADIMSDLADALLNE